MTSDWCYVHQAIVLRACRVLQLRTGVRLHPKANLRLMRPVLLQPTPVVLQLTPPTPVVLQLMACHSGAMLQVC